MTLDAQQVWAPGARHDIPLVPVDGARERERVRRDGRRSDRSTRRCAGRARRRRHPAHHADRRRARHPAVHRAVRRRRRGGAVATGQWRAARHASAVVGRGAHDSRARRHPDRMPLGRHDTSIVTFGVRRREPRGGAGGHDRGVRRVPARAACRGRRRGRDRARPAGTRLCGVRGRCRQGDRIRPRAGIRPRRAACALHVVLVPSGTRRRGLSSRTRASRRSSASARSSSTTGGRRRMPHAATARAATGRSSPARSPTRARSYASSKISACERCGGSARPSSATDRRRTRTPRSPWRTRRTGLEAAVLDPRSPAARRFVVARLRALLADSGAHGFKIDFLERFAQTGGEPPVDADDGVDRRRVPCGCSTTSARSPARSRS